MKFHCVAQTGGQWLFTDAIIAHHSLELLASSSPPALASLAFSLLAGFPTVPSLAASVLSQPVLDSESRGFWL